MTQIGTFGEAACHVSSDSFYTSRPSMGEANHEVKLFELQEVQEVVEVQKRINRT
jgi:hypothetical protein